MKTILLFLGLCISTGSFSQQTDWEKKCKENPRTVLAEAEEMYQEALKQHNDPKLVLSLLLKTQCKSVIDPDSLPSDLLQLEKELLTTQEATVKSLLHSIAAEFYQDYYFSHSFEINQRIALADFVPENMAEWSSNLFVKKITEHALAALQSPQILQQTPVSAYNLILITGKDTPTLRPTLFDFISHRSIAQLQSCQEPINLLCPSSDTPVIPVLSALKDFINLRLPSQNLTISTEILKIYQHLLKYRLTENNRAALLIADLERLSYCRTLTNEDTLYLKRLQELEQDFKDLPYVIEVLAEEARWYQKENTENSLKQALAICQQGLVMYPNYSRIGLLKNLKAHIVKPSLDITLPEAPYPNKSLLLSATYKNISFFKVDIFRIHETGLSYEKKKGEHTTIHREKIRSHHFVLPTTLISLDTSFRLGALPNGLYELRIDTDKNRPDTLSFIVTDLFTVTQNTGQGNINFMVRDSESGKTKSNVTVTVYQSNNHSYRIPDLARLTPLAHLTTDINGIAVFKASSYKNKLLYYEVTDKNNPNNCIKSYYYSGFFPDRANNPAEKIALFTDRTVYRPGQTVYFSGIAWETYGDKANVLDNTSYRIQLQNYTAPKEIQELTVITNEWGSFSGSFVLPKESLNGTYFITSSKGRIDFEVAAYKRPQLEILLCPQKKAYTFGDTIQVEGKIKTYSGISLPDTKIRYQITLKTLYRWQKQSDVTAKGETTTDSKGDFVIAFPTCLPSLSEERYMYEVTLSASDTKGETQQITANIPINREPYTLQVDVNEYLNKNKTTTLSVYAQNASGYRLKEKIKYTIYRLKPLTSPEAVYHPDSLPVQSVMQEGFLELPLDSLTPDFSKWPSGAYAIQITGENKKYENIGIKKIFYLYSLTDKRPPLTTYNWVEEIKTSCDAGENAEILFGTSVENVYLLYELYNECRLIKREILKLSNENILLSVPCEEDDKNLCLILSFVKNGKFFSNEIPIKRVRKEQELRFKTKVFRDKLQPGQKEKWEFTVTNGKGTPVVAEVMAVMYDQSLDKFRPNNWIFDPFFNLAFYCPGWTNDNYDRNDLYFRFTTPFFKVPAFRFDRFILLQPESGFIEREEAVSDGIPAPRSLYKAKTAKSVMYSNDLEAGAAQGEAATDLPVLRENFQETAFFYPQLVTSDSGIVTLHFTMPDATTRWKFMALAHTRDLSHGSILKEVTTSRQLMVSPNLPRYFRSDDHVLLKTLLSNLSGSDQTGKITFEWFDPLSNRTILKQEKDFSVKPGENTTVSFEFTVPENRSIIGCRTIATTPEFSDGEQHLVAIVPNNILLTEAMPFYTQQSGSHTYKLQHLSDKQDNYRLTLELTANPIWYAVLAIPALQDPQEKNITDISAAFYVNTIGHRIVTSNPKIAAAIHTWENRKTDTVTLLSKLEQNEELKTLLLSASPWALEAQNETERMQALAQLFDLNRLRYLQEKALKSMAELQKDDGGWSWFKGMQSDRFITCQVLTTLATSSTTGQRESGEKETMMQMKALRYLDKEIKSDFKNQKTQKNLSYSQILYLYTRSAYRDIPLGDALEAHKYYLSLLEKQWPDRSLYEKALAAMTLFRYGKSETAIRILRSLKEYATTTPDLGMYWASPKSRNTSLNSTLQVHTSLMEAFYEIEGNTSDTELMKQWLLRQKQTQNWGNVPNTVNAIYALLLTGNSQLDIPEKLTVAVGSQKLILPETDQLLGYVKKVYPASEISPALSTVTLNKSKDTPTWGALYLQYFESLKQIRKNKNSILNVEKKLFIEKDTKTGKELREIVDGLRVGDKVVVRLTVTLDRDMQYVHLQDLRAACFEPVGQISGNRWKYGTSYYEEIKDGVSNFFISYLAKGTYVFEYPVWVGQAGIYQDGTATIQSVYAPEYVSHSLTREITVE